jgi:hypothetical protein
MYDKGVKERDKKSETLFISSNLFLASIVTVREWPRSFFQTGKAIRLIFYPQLAHPNFELY